MNPLLPAVEEVRREQRKSGKPLAVILAGHNGSGKSTMWLDHLAVDFQIPLVNADRMMMSILPEPGKARLPQWAQTLRDNDESWMEVAQKGVEAFVAQAMSRKVAFAMETVFSHWKDLGNGKIESKVELIREMQAAGYFVLLFFVGLSSEQLSIARVSTRVARGGHAVDVKRLISRFPRTQRAIQIGVSVADAAILADNSRKKIHAFTVCRVQIGEKEVFDLRGQPKKIPTEISQWLDVVSPKKS